MVREVSGVEEEGIARDVEKAKTTVHSTETIRGC